jgi:hypothetical protein
MIDAIVDTGKYPLKPNSPGVARLAAQFGEEGILVLDNFIRASAVARLEEEGRSLRPLGHRVTSTHQVTYPAAGVAATEPPDPHERVKFDLDESYEVVAYDQFPQASELRTLYQSQELLNFLSAVLGVRPLYRYADALGALNLTYMVKGDTLGWHFDSTDFVVSLGIASPEDGGLFETVRSIRTDADPAVQRVAGVVIRNDCDAVESYPIRPGTLMLFNGRHSIHRVTSVDGTMPRMVLLLGYDRRPDAAPSDESKLVRYGRVR